MTTPTLLTIRQFAAKHPAFTEASLRWLRFNQETNGFRDAFVKVGARVFIEEETFFAAVREQAEADRVERGRWAERSTR